MDFPPKVPFFQEGESVLYLVTSISFQFIDLVTHQTSTLGHAPVGDPRAEAVTSVHRKGTVILGLRSPLLRLASVPEGFLVR